MLTPAQKSQLIAAKLRILDLLLTNTHALLKLTTEQSQQLETTFNNLVISVDTLNILANSFPEQSEPSLELKKRFDAQVISIEDSFAKFINIIFEKLPNENKDALKAEFIALFLSEESVEKEIDEAKKPTIFPSEIADATQIQSHIHALKADTNFLIDTQIKVMDAFFEDFLIKLVKDPVSVPTFNKLYSADSIATAKEASKEEDFQQFFYAQLGEELKKRIGDPQRKPEAVVALRNTAKELIQANNMANLADLLHPNQGATKEFNDIFALLTESQKSELLIQLFSKEKPSTFLRNISTATQLIDSIKEPHQQESEKFRDSIKKQVLDSTKKYPVKITETTSGDTKAYTFDNENNLASILEQLIDKLLVLSTKHPAYVQRVCSAILKAIEQTSDLKKAKNDTAFLGGYLLTRFICLMLALTSAKDFKSDKDSDKKQLFLILSKIIQILANPTPEVLDKHSEFPRTLLETLAGKFAEKIKNYLLTVAAPQNLLQAATNTTNSIDLTLEYMNPDVINRKHIMEKIVRFQACNKAFIYYRQQFLQLQGANTQEQTLDLNTQLIVISPETLLEFRQKILDAIKAVSKEANEVISALQIQINKLCDDLKSTDSKASNDIFESMLLLKQQQEALSKISSFKQQNLLSLYYIIGELQAKYEKLKYAFPPDSASKLINGIQENAYETVFQSLISAYREISEDTKQYDSLKKLSDIACEEFIKIMLETYRSLKPDTEEKSTANIEEGNMDSSPNNAASKPTITAADLAKNNLKYQNNIKAKKLETLSQQLKTFQERYTKFLETHTIASSNNSAPASTAVGSLPPGSAAAVASSSPLFSNPAEGETMLPTPNLQIRTSKALPLSITTTGSRFSSLTENPFLPEADEFEDVTPIPSTTPTFTHGGGDNN